MHISFSLTWKDIVTLGWLTGLVMLISLALGSIGEVEPRAALMFGGIALVWAALAWPMFQWRNRRNG